MENTATFERNINMEQSCFQQLKNANPRLAYAMLSHYYSKDFTFRISYKSFHDMSKEEIDNYYSHHKEEIDNIKIRLSTD